jgi:hypothetical protein
MPDITPFTDKEERGIPAMQLELTLELEIKITDGPININGIIKAVHLYQNELGRNIVREILEAIDRQACNQAIERFPLRYRNKGYSSRQFRTPMGNVGVRFTKFIDSWDSHTCHPGKKALEVPSYKRWLPWCLTPAAGMLAKVSFSQSSKETARLQGEAPSKSTIHRRLEELVGNGSFTPYLRKRWFRYLMVDGTGARFQNRQDNGGSAFYEGEIRFAFAAVREDSPFELVGMWVNKEWSECAKELYTRMNTERLEVLISDGGPGIEDAFLLSGMRTQRCQWHGKRDLSFILYADGAKKAQQEEIMAAFDAIPLVGWQKNDIETLRKEDASGLNDLRQKTLRSFCDLYFFLQSKGYHKAAVYVSNLAKPFVSFIEHLLETGKVVHTTSNIIEGKISLFKNRIKAIGKRWSEAGLLRWLAIAVRKLLPEFDWNTLWDNITGNPLPVEIKLSMISTKSGCH